MGELVIPQSVKEAIGNRLNRVSEKGNEVLRAAAVLGKTFSFEELKAAARDTGEEALLDALDESSSAQLITPGRDDSKWKLRSLIGVGFFSGLIHVHVAHVHVRMLLGVHVCMDVSVRVVRIW